MSCLARALARERQWLRTQHAKRSKIARDACRRQEAAQWNEREAARVRPRFADAE